MNLCHSKAVWLCINHDQTSHKMHPSLLLAQVLVAGCCTIRTLFPSTVMLPVVVVGVVCFCSVLTCNSSEGWTQHYPVHGTEQPVQGGYTLNSGGHLHHFASRHIKACAAGPPGGTESLVSLCKLDSQSAGPDPACHSPCSAWRWPVPGILAVHGPLLHPVLHRLLCEFGQLVQYITQLLGNHMKY